MLQPKVPQRIRSICSTILISNDLLWSDPKLTHMEIGHDIYCGINADSDGVIRASWLKLAEFKVKETSDLFCATGTQITWALYFSNQNGIQMAWAVQMTHRQDTIVDSEPFTDISDH